MLGALPTQADAAKRIQTLQSSPSNLQTFATQTGQTYDSSKPIVPITPVLPATPQNNNDGGSDTMEMIKKYAPYIIAGGIILYLILRNKK
jgi:hypothetical protein